MTAPAISRIEAPLTSDDVRFASFLFGRKLLTSFTETQLREARSEAESMIDELEAAVVRLRHGAKATLADRRHLCGQIQRLQARADRLAYAAVHLER